MRGSGLLASTAMAKWAGYMISINEGVYYFPPLNNSSRRQKRIYLLCNYVAAILQGQPHSPLGDYVGDVYHFCLSFTDGS